MRILVIIFILTSISIFGQNEVFYKSPSVRSFEKVNTSEPDLFTGTMSINIPIYEIDCNGYKLPISLNYKTSGIKVDEIASIVGLGWNLNFGGSLNVNIRGLEDFAYRGYSRPERIFDNQPAYSLFGIRTFYGWPGPGYNGGDPTFIYIRNATTGYSENATPSPYDSFFYSQPSDSEPDKYSYFLPNGKSGKFYSDQAGKIHSVPASNIKFEIGNKNKIIDDDGNNYLFGKGSFSTPYYTEAYQLLRNNNYSLHLEKITTSTTNEINFDYYDVGYSHYTGVNQKKYVLCPNCLYQTVHGVISEPQEVDEKVISYINESYIRTISFDQGRVEFIYNSNDDMRKDLLGSKFLKRIEVWNKYKIIKSIDFQYSYFESPPNTITNIPLEDTEQKRQQYFHRLKLMSVKFSDGSEYRFNYNETPLPARLTYSQDYWGYNNNTWNSTLIAEYSNREPDSLYTQSGILKEIEYPYGGKSKFFYESNFHNGIYYSGVRIKERIDESLNGNLSTKYRYSNPIATSTSSISPTFNSKIILFDNFQSIGCDIEDCKEEYDVYSANSYSPLGTVNGTDVAYQYVEIDDGKSIQKFTFSFNSDSENSSRYNFTLDDNSWKRGLLLSKLDYNKNGTLLSATTYNHNFNYSKNSQATPQISNGTTEHLLIGMKGVLYSQEKQNTFHLSQTILANSYNISSAWIQNDNIDRKEFINGITIKNNSQFFFDNNSLVLQPISSKKEYSDGKIEKTETKWVDSFLSIPIMKELYDLNKVSSPIVNKKYVGSKLLVKDSIAYDKSSSTSHLILPVRKYVKYGEGAFTSNDIEISYDLYGHNATLRQYTLRSGIPVAIVWGYNNTKPIAKIEGATYDSISGLISSIINESNNDDLQGTSATENALISALDLFRTNSAFSNYQITTYTYDPLIGVTSITPPSGIREIYNYDSANRLQSVVDINGNILKEYSYQYKQQ